MFVNVDHFHPSLVFAGKAASKLECFSNPSLIFLGIFLTF
jgi:hypothetical protein